MRCHFNGFWGIDAHQQIIFLELDPDGQHIRTEIGCHKRIKSYSNLAKCHQWNVFLDFARSVGLLEDLEWH